MSGAGYQEAGFSSSVLATHKFLIKSMMARVRTCLLVKVTAVTNAGAVQPVGFVDIVPLVNQMDGAGVGVPHGVIANCPYSRIQGGANAIILDPQIGDIGIAVFADRDIASVVATRKQSNPGSWRKHSMADALYLGGCLNAIPTQFVQFNEAGITVTSPQTVTVNAPNIALVGNVASTGTFLNNGVNIGSTHAHGKVQSGTANSGVPH